MTTAANIVNWIFFRKKKNPHIRKPNFIYFAELWLVETEMVKNYQQKVCEGTENGVTPRSLKK